MGFDKSQQRFRRPQNNSGPTRFLYVSGVGDEMGTKESSLVEIFSQFGEIDFSDGYGIDLVPNRRYCFVCFVEVESAMKALQHFSAEYELPNLPQTKIMVRYAEEVKEKIIPKIDCTSSTNHIEVPGLFLIEEFVNPEEEEGLLSEFGSDNSPWKDSISRRVQHYGFPFNYRTLMLDYSKATPPMPQSLDKFITRMCDENKHLMDEVSDKDFNQLTINEYLPGQGIASHTDTESCLGPIIFVISLGSGIVMNFTENASRASTGKQSLISQVSTLETGDSPVGEAVRKLKYLPQRSLLVLSGDARFKWSHGIVKRKSDVVEGVEVKRGRRVSFTFRQGMLPGPIPSEQLQTSEIELDHVVRVYDNIATHWNHTRGKRKVHWHTVKEFLEALPVGTLLADIGSGDGKYFGVNERIVSLGCDRSWKLLQVSKEASHETFCCDAAKLPLLSDSFDATLCIAVLHHMATIDRRAAVIRELVRITRPGGAVLLQAWAFEQGNDSKHAFQAQDTMVPWRLNKRFLKEEEEKLKKLSRTLEKTALEVSNDLENSGACQHALEDDDQILFQRYCHVYKEGELEDLCSRIVESGWDKGNWFIRLEKMDASNEKRVAQNMKLGPAASLPGIVPRI